MYGKELAIPLAKNMEDSLDNGYLDYLDNGILSAKDQGLVSDKAYHELRMALPEDIRDRIPPLFKKEENKTRRLTQYLYHK